MSKNTKSPHLGKTATDKVTGFEGLVTGHCEYITGCDTFLVVPKAKDDNTWVDGRWLDEARLTFSKEVELKLDLEDEDPGADLEPPKK